MWRDATRCLGAGRGAGGRAQRDDSPEFWGGFGRMPGPVWGGKGLVGAWPAPSALRQNRTGEPSLDRCRSRYRMRGARRIPAGPFTVDMDDFEESNVTRSPFYRHGWNKAKATATGARTLCAAIGEVSYRYAPVMVQRLSGVILPDSFPPCLTSNRSNIKVSKRTRAVVRVRRFAHILVTPAESALTPE